MSLSDSLFSLLSHPGYQPLNQKALARRLHLKPSQSAELALLLETAEAEGRITRVQNDCFVPAERLGLIAGKLHMNERGFGFLIPDSEKQPDVYIAARDVKNAFHGDRVLVRLNQRRGPRRRAGEKEKFEGQVVKVLRRARTQIVGTLQKTKLFHYVIPDDRRIPHDIYVPEPAPPLPLGHKVVVKLADWPSRHVNPEGTVIEDLGDAREPGVDLLSIIRKHELPVEFPAETVREAETIAEAIPASEIARREDYRTLHTLTIDPDDAKDFDDAISYVPLPDGSGELYVHIADVSHYVRPGGALDREARSRGNSVYLVDRVIPMLPEKLSNGICSLQPQVERLVKTVIIRLHKDGRVLGHRFAEGIIRSARRFTYQEAYKLLKMKSPGPEGVYLQNLWRVAEQLRRRRFQQGALALDFPEIKVRLDAQGVPVRLERMENDESHQLIEEFMLLANEVVAAELKRRQVPAVYRIHEKPSPDRLEEFRSQVQSMGFKIGNLSNRGEIQKLLQKVTGTLEEPVVRINLLRSLKRAVYSHQPLGHYGLAKVNYTHFTSPIRRYADLIVHRVLFHDTRNAPFQDSSDLKQTALHLSQTERTASDAEQESVKLKKLEYFSIQANASHKKLFKALVLEAKAFGLVVEIPEFVVQGRIALQNIKGDLFTFDFRNLELRGQRTKRLLKAGQTLWVQVAQVDLLKQQIEFAFDASNKGPKI
jgi:ribonuclease R